MKAALKNLITALVFLSLCAVIGLVLGCPVKRVTGFPCPGCGMTRGCLALAAGDFSAAFHYHPLCFFSLPALLLYVLKDVPLIKKIFIRHSLLVFFSLMCIAIYFIRMALYFPNVSPMNFEKNSLIGKIVLNLLLH